MKKFGTPGLAAPGVASESVGGLSLAGACPCAAWLSGAVGAAGVGVGVATLPVSDSVLAAPEVWLAGFSTCRLTVFGVDPCLEGARGVEVAVGFGDWVGAAVAATVGAAVGVGVESVEPRSTIEAIGAGSPGICSWLTGVPGGMSTVIVSCWPGASVTRT